MNLDLEVRMRVDLDEMIEARTANVSREGLFIAMDRPKPVGTKVRVKLEVGEAASAQQFVLEGIVVRAVPDPDHPETRRPGEPAGVGVFLTATSAGWARFCDKLAEKRAHRAEITAKILVSNGQR